MHCTTASLLGTARQTLTTVTTRLTTQHKLTLCESALMIHLNHAMGIGLSTKEPHHHMQRVSQAAGIAALVSPHAHRQMTIPSNSYYRTAIETNACVLFS